MNAQEFLQTVITTPLGYLELGTRLPDQNYKQHWFEWPTDLDKVCNFARQSALTGDVYFSSHLFSTRNSHKENVLPSRTIQQDLDNADINALLLAPSILVSTSPNRHQGYWITSTDFDSIQVQEELSKKLAYSIPLCDRSGWPLGHKVRFPFTKNYKYTQGPYPVELATITSRKFTIDELELIPSVPALSQSRIPNGEFIDNPPSLDFYTNIDIKGPYEIVEGIKDSLTAKVYAEYMQDSPSQDRSVSLFALTTQCFRAGLTREEVFWVAYNSPNNKFKQDQRFNDLRELAKDVIRAEHAVKDAASIQDIRALINDIRKKTKTLQSERRYSIYGIVEAAMKLHGDFVHAVDGRRYYVARDTGRPIDMDLWSEELHSLLDITYSLNKTEVEHAYVANALVSYTGQLPESSEVHVLSKYDQASQHVLVHSGRKEVYDVTPTGVQTIPNGSYNTIFPWDRIIEPFHPQTNATKTPIDWASLLFDIPNVINMTREEARITLKVWVLFSLLRDVAASRPILAFFGSPGSGKTSTARRIYAFIYGKHLDVSGATSPVDFDIATATLPFYVLDNLDTWEKWIPDRLAQSAGKTDVIVRKLYTNSQIIRLKRQAMVIVTAHDPKFGRADVTDRMLIISLQRFSTMGIPFQDEGHLLEEVISNRNKIWSAVLQDLSCILATPFPEHTDLQLRIQDFARIGEWIAIALGEQDIFRSAVYSLQSAQRTFNLDEDHILVNALQNWVEKSKGHTTDKTQDDLYNEVLMCVSTADYRTFTTMYKNSGGFVRRLSTLQDTLSNTVLRVSFILDRNGSRLWTILPPEH